MGKQRNKKLVNGGGQTRTIKCGCGFSLKGDPIGIQLQWKLHTKCCDRQNSKDVANKSFDKQQSINNGKTKWDKNRVIQISKVTITNETVKGYETNEITKTNQRI